MLNALCVFLLHTDGRRINSQVDIPDASQPYSSLSFDGSSLSSSPPQSDSAASSTSMRIYHCLFPYSASSGCFAWGKPAAVGCESWTLTAELQRRIQAMEMRCCHKILCISYKDDVTNEEVCAKIQQAIGPSKDVLTTINRHKLQWFGHVSHVSCLAKTI